VDTVGDSELRQNDKGLVKTLSLLEKEEGIHLDPIAFEGDSTFMFPEGVQLKVISSVSWNSKIY
jgi:hypothetical protein